MTKYLYGLKQAGKEWNDNVTNTLISNGYLPTEDASVFYRKENADFILMSIHVDNFYVISTTQAMLDKLYNELIIKYKDISRKSGNELSYLGFVIKRDNYNQYLQITQPTYVDKILKEASMEQFNGMSTPISISVDNEDINDNYEYVDKQYYLKLVGLRRLLNSLGWSQSEPTVIYEDNQSCIKMLYQKELNHHTTKHINPKFHLTRQLIKNQELIVKYCPTGQMVADILTKPLGKAQH